MRKARLTRRSRTLQSILIRAVAAVAILHYTALVLIYHGFLISSGKDALLSAQELIDQPWIHPFRGSNQQELKLRVLWAIESKNTNEERKRRQLLRETYLTYDYDPSKPSNSTEKMFCSLHEVEPGIANCIFFYAFVVREKGVASESDVLHLNDIQDGGLQEFLEYGMTMSEKYSLTAMAWVQLDVHVFPLELIDFLTPRLSTAFYAETPDKLLDFRCNGCLWDQESSRRTGRFFMASTKSVQIMRERGQECESLFSNFQQMFKFCVMESASAPDAIIEIHTIGHQYQQRDLEKYRVEWEVHKKMLSAYRDFQKKNAIHYVSGKFSRTPHQFTNDFHSLRTAMSAWGMLPTQIFFYDSVFPDFITNDYRWEQHIEFLTDSELNDEGGGYWFWKAPLIEHHFELASDGDFIIFGDAHTWNHFPWMMELLETMVARQANFAVYHVHFPENQWTKRDLYQLLCGDIPSRDVAKDESEQYAGTFFVLRKSPGTNAFVREYTRLISNYHLVSDEKGELPEIPVFREHRRDQSILSLLLKCKFMESGKEEFVHPNIKDLGWWKAFTFNLKPLK